MATLSLRLWSNIKPKKLDILHLSGDFALLCSDPLCGDFTAELSEAGLFRACEKTSPSNPHIGPSPLNKHDVYILHSIYDSLR